MQPLIASGVDKANVVIKAGVVELTWFVGSPGVVGKTRVVVGSIVTIAIGIGLL